MVKRKEEKKVKEDDTQIKEVSRETLLELERRGYEIRIAQKDVELVKSKADKAHVESTLLSANYTLKLKEKSELSEQHKNAEKRYEEVRNYFLDFKEEITKEYNLPNKWSFDPISGEILLN